MKIKDLSKPQNFKSLKQIKSLRKKYKCIKQKTHLLLALCIKFLANNKKSKLCGLKKKMSKIGPVVKQKLHFSLKSGV